MLLVFIYQSILKIKQKLFNSKFFLYIIFFFFIYSLLFWDYKKNNIWVHLYNLYKNWKQNIQKCEWFLKFKVNFIEY